MRNFQKCTKSNEKLPKCTKYQEKLPNMHKIPRGGSSENAKNLMIDFK
jgi:hypothetical protein